MGMSARISVLYGDIMSALLRTRVRNSRVKAGKAHPEFYRHSRLVCTLVPLGLLKVCDGASISFLKRQIHLTENSVTGLITVRRGYLCPSWCRDQ